MYDWPVGLSTGCFYRHSILGCLEAIRRAGFLTLEICSHPDHLDYRDAGAVRRAHDEIRRLGMEPYSFHAPFAPEIDISTLDDHRRESAAREILLAVEAAGFLGARYFVLHPGPEKVLHPHPPERFRRAENALSVIRRTAAHCRARGMTLLLENMLPHLFRGHPRDLLWDLASIPEATVGVCLDTGHAALGEDLCGDVRKLAGHLRMVHAHDNGGQEDDHRVPGQGIIPWERFMAALGRVDFRGSLILELGGDRQVPADVVLNEARAARNFLRGLGARLERTQAADDQASGTKAGRDAQSRRQRDTST